jgi:hypothetical protein
MHFYKDAILSFFRRCLYIQDFQHILPLKYEALSKLNKFAPHFNTFPPDTRTKISTFRFNQNLFLLCAAKVAKL